MSSPEANTVQCPGLTLWPGCSSTGTNTWTDGRANDRGRRIGRSGETWLCLGVGGHVGALTRCAGIGFCFSRLKAHLFSYLLFFVSLPPLPTHRPFPLRRRLLRRPRRLSFVPVVIASNLDWSALQRRSPASRHPCRSLVSTLILSFTPLVSLFHHSVHHPAPSNIWTPLSDDSKVDGAGAMSAINPMPAPHTNLTTHQQRQCRTFRSRPQRPLPTPMHRQRSRRTEHSSLNSRELRH